MSQPALAKDRIADTLVQLLAERGSGEAIPVKELISRSGVHRSSYYYQFRKVGDVVMFVIDQFVGEYERVLGGYGGSSIETAKPDFHSGTQAILEFILSHRDAFLALRHSTYRDLFRFKLIDVTRGCFEGYGWYQSDEGGSERRIGHAMRQYLSYFAGYQFYSFVECWAKRSFEESPEELVEIIYEVFEMNLSSFRREDR